MDSADHNLRHETSWLLIVVVALALAVGMFTLSNNVGQRDQQRLAVFQAQNVRTGVTALISQIESTMSSVGSVAAATNGARVP
jgi:hypothetical protein